jgi:hypothetical protein
MLNSFYSTTINSPPSPAAAFASCGDANAKNDKLSANANAIDNTRFIFIFILPFA